MLAAVLLAGAMVLPRAATGFRCGQSGMCSHGKVAPFFGDISSSELKGT